MESIADSQLALHAEMQSMPYAQGGQQPISGLLSSKRTEWRCLNPSSKSSILSSNLYTKKVSQRLGDILCQISG